MAISFGYADTSFYSISTCTSDSYEDALRCKNLISKKGQAEIFIIQSDDLKFRTTYGEFDSYTKIKQFEKNLPKVIIDQKPFVKHFNLSNDSVKFIEKYLPINFNQPIIIETNISHLNTKEIEIENIQQIEVEANPTPPLDPLEVIEKSDNSANVAIKVQNKSQNLFDSIVLFLKESFGLSKEKEEPLTQKIDAIEKTDNNLIENNNTDLFETVQEEEKLSIEAKGLTTTKIEGENNRSANNKNLFPKQVTPTKKQIIVPKQESPQLVSVIQHNRSQKTQSKEKDTHTISYLASKERLSEYDQLILLVDSTTNRMYLQGKKGEMITILNEFIVSTAREGAKKPQGEGEITAISLSPIWYPTEKTIKHFKEDKGIDLPAAVLPGDKLNYMGAAKINLSHSVNGRDIYRIHGTLNEKSIGTKESSGCIRMKNKEVLELAKLLKKFASAKGSLQSVKVILK